jgi:hypothetical protein
LPPAVPVVKFAAGVIVTGGKFSTGVVDTGGKFATGVIETSGALSFFKIFVCAGRVADPTSLFPPDLFLYVNFVARVHRMSFRTLAPRLTVLDIPHFADAYSPTMRPIDLHNFKGHYPEPSQSLFSCIILPLLEVQIFLTQVSPLAELSKVLRHAVVSTE